MKPITKFAIVVMMAIAFLGSVLYVSSAPVKNTEVVVEK